jgi:CRISPR type IV-associated protein Csf3
MEALQIECQMAGAWCPPAFGLHLDGLIAWSLVQESLNSGHVVDDYEAIISDLPFDRHECGAWCASQFFPVGWAGQEQRYFTGKTPVEDMAKYIGAGAVETKGGSIIDTARGIAKNHQGYITLELVRGLRAWCLGDADAIEELLSKVHAVGVKTRMGFGSLLPFDDGKLWRITPSKDANQHWMRRSLPTRLTEDSYPSFGSWRAPYWRGNDSIWRPVPLRLEA